ncbi:hypothetical protein KCU66_g32, partial [Aureobasidium melanogenum]
MSDITQPCTLRNPRCVDGVDGCKKILEIISTHEWSELGGLLVLNIYSRNSITDVAHDIFQEAEISVVLEKASLCLAQICVMFPLLHSAHNHRQQWPALAPGG